MLNILQKNIFLRIFLVFQYKCLIVLKSRYIYLKCKDEQMKSYETEQNEFMINKNKNLSMS